MPEDTPELEEKFVDEEGYHHVLLISEEGEAAYHYVHEMVAQAFVPNPNCYELVIHKDRNLNNNAASNLAWVSEFEYWLHHNSSGSPEVNGRN